MLLEMKWIQAIFTLSWLCLGYSCGNAAVVHKDSARPNNSPEKRAQEQRILPVTVLEVRRSISADSQVMFTVRYKPEVNDFSIVWRDFRNENGAPMDVSASQSFVDGTLESSVVVPPRNVTDDYFRHKVIRVEFTSNNGRVMLELLNDSGDDVATDIDIPILDVEPSGDFVYQEGEDLVFKFTGPLMTRTPGPNGMIASSQWTTELVDPVSGDVLLDSVDEDQLMELVENKIFSDHQEFTIKLKTSQYKTSGIFMFSSQLLAETELTLLIQTVQISDFRILRPSTQDGPFPPGYVGIIRSHNLRTDDNGVVWQLCSEESYNSVCFIECLASEEELKDLQLVRLADDGTREQLENIPRFEYIEPHETMGSVKSVGAVFSFKTTPGAFERFQCIATNTEGQTATKDVGVEYFVPVDILEEQSGIEITTNEATGERKVSVACKVRGRPPPEVTFTIVTTDAFYFQQSPDEVFDDGPDEYRLVKSVSLDIRDYHGHTMPELTSASCSADNGSPYFVHDYYLIPIPDKRNML